MKTIALAVVAITAVFLFFSYSSEQPSINLSAYAVLDESTQQSCLSEYYHGEEYRFALFEIVEDRSTEERRRVRAKKMIDYIQLIDELTAKEIKLIDDLKIELLKKNGENVSVNGFNYVIVSPYDAAEPLKPTRMNLKNIKEKNGFDVVKEVLGIAKSSTFPTDKGKQLWESYNQYRGELAALVVKSSSTETKTYNFIDPKINQFSDYEDLRNQLMGPVKNISPDDMEAVAKIYISLTKLERNQENEKKVVHWVNHTFNDTPLIASVALLTTLQREILNARAFAIEILRARV